MLDKDALLQDFPNIKLSYENIIHKKVFNAELMLVIPDGKKYLCWFAENNGECFCYLLELKTNQKGLIFNVRVSKDDIIQMNITNCCFNKSLCDGTVLYGTLFDHLQNKFFSIEDIHYYKGTPMCRNNWKHKMNTIIHLLKKELKQISFNNHFTVFGLPLMADTHDALDGFIKNDIKYKVGYIQYRNLHESTS